MIDRKYADSNGNPIRVATEDFVADLMNEARSRQSTHRVVLAACVPSFISRPDPMTTTDGIGVFAK